MTELVLPQVVPDPCPLCHSTRRVRDYTRGDVICPACGCVVERIIEYGPEWWNSRTDDKTWRDPTRNGPPHSALQADELATQMKPQRRDINGALLENCPKWFRLRRINNRTSHKKEHLRRAMTEIKRLCSQLQLSPSVREKAARLYRKILYAGGIQGHTIDGMVAACVYLTARHYNPLLSVKEVAHVSPRSVKTVARSVWVIRRDWENPKPSEESLQLLKRLGIELALSPATIQKARDLLKKCKDHRIGMGRKPACMVAAIVYLASIITGERKLQRKIADIAQVTEVSVRNRAKEIVRILELEAPAIPRGPIPKLKEED